MHRQNCENKKFFKALILSSDVYDESVQKLKELGIEVIWSFENKSVSPYLSKHVDMQLVKITDKCYICSPECFDYYKKIFSHFNINLISGDTYLSSNYPGDIAYNIVIGERYAVHNFKYTDSILKESLTNKTFVDVSQGYCRCTLCCLPSESYITSDEGIVKSLSAHKDISMLKISQGNVLLNGFSYGFFGGASFMIGPRCLAVNGDITTHPECDKILDFCTKKNVEVLSLSPKNVLMDIGSAVSIV